MEIEKLIKVKKGATIKDTMIIIVVFIAFFGVFYTFVGNNAQEAGVAIDSKYNDSYNRLLEKQQNVTVLLDDLSSASANLTEAKVGDFAFFGLRGVLQLMKLPLVLPSIIADAFSIVTVNVPMPTEIKFALGMVLLIVILFTIIKFVTSRGTDA